MERFTREEEKGEDYEKVAQESGCCLRHVTRALIWKGEKQRCFVVVVLVSGGGQILELRCEVQVNLIVVGFRTQQVVVVVHLKWIKKGMFYIR